tara:strand:+ start:366 stop:482 length:117 start_codon:yes stop_codon:yes gene_type:complete
MIEESIREQRRQERKNISQREKVGLIIELEELAKENSV